jgi:hypothetical protein
MAKRRNQINRQLKRETRERKSQERFIASPTAQKAKRTARAQANVIYKPVLRGLRSEVAGSKKREGELGSWYGGLTSQIGQAQQSAATSSQAAESALTQRLANASASDQTALKETASKNEALGKLLGTNQVGVSNAPSASAGATAIAQQRVALTSPLTAERANYQNYLGQRGVSATERGIEARKAETSRRRKIKEDLRAGKKERGQAVVSNLEKLREGARDFAIQKQAFGQKGKELAVSSKEAAIDRAQKARENAADRAVSRFSAGSTRISAEASKKNANLAGRKLKQEEREGKGKGGVSHKAFAAAKSHYETGTTRKIFNKKTEEWETRDNLPFRSWGELATEVSKESEIDPVEARRAVAVIRKKAEAKEKRLAAKNKRSSAVKKALPFGF